MPRLSDTMEEGTIARWVKQPGDKVERGDILAEIETDKAVMELEAYDPGVLEQILVNEGETVPIGQPIAMVGTGEGGAAAPAAAKPAAEEQPKAAPAAEAPPAAPAGAAPAPSGNGAAAPAPAPAAAGQRVKASPLARAIASEHGIDLASVKGSGPNGRVVREDVMAIVRGDLKAPAAPAAGAAPAAAAVPILEPGEDDEVIALTGMRKVVAKRLVESMQQAPHFYLTAKVDVGPLLKLRSDLNKRLAEQGIKVSVNDLLVKAAATAIRNNLGVNVSWGGDKILKHNRVHVGIAVAVSGGLVVPVVRDADQKSLTQVSKEAKELIGKARDGKLKPNEMSGSTFTISNLGMYGISQFTAVINPPEAGILAVGATEPELALQDGRVIERQVMRVTLSIDHRALDGASGAEFLQQLVAVIEEPLRILA